MRTIKFRGKAMDTGKWIYGYIYEDSAVNTKPRYYILTVSNTCLDPTEVSPETVGQSLGREDKNGNELFDGDVVKWDHSFEKHGKKVEDIGVGKIIYENGCFEVYGGYCFCCCVQYEVIGNITDNSELLEDNNVDSKE